MPEYRAYIVSDKNDFLGFEPLVCADDEAAMAAAKRLVDGHDIELWQSDRMVTRLVHKAGSETE